MKAATRVLRLPAWRLYLVRGVSMMPSFEPGDGLLVRTDGFGHRGPPARGEAVIVRDPRDFDKSYLKRVVGLPGEQVRLTEGILLVDGKRLIEPYLGGLPASPGLGNQSWALVSGQYFVLGDNRAHSTDSREFGPVILGQIIGDVRLRCWPISRWGAVGRAGDSH